MSVAPDPAEIFERAAEEVERRLGQSLLELVATSFIAGFTIVFGLVALGIVHAAVEPRFGGVARIAGALAFGIGVVFLVAGRAELFNENFYDPTARVVRVSDWGLLPSLLRLWTVSFALNLVGGTVFAYVVSVEGTLPAGAGSVLTEVATERVSRGATTGFASAIVGGALVSLLSFLLQAVDGVGSRLGLAYAVGFLLALGPFHHVVVTVLHVVLGIFYGANIGLADLAAVIAAATTGNLVGGLGLVTLTHLAQAIGAEESGG